MPNFFCTIVYNDIYIIVNFIIKKKVMLKILLKKD
jgi:hypothetical protein